MSQTLIPYQKILSLFHGNLNFPLKVLYKIKNKTNVKAEIAQNDTDLSCIKLDINVSKCCAFVKHFETLILSVILFWLLHVSYFFCTGHVKEHLNFH